MKIISNFRDFYDSVQIYNSSKEFIWIRKTEEFNLSRFPELSNRFSFHKNLNSGKIYFPNYIYHNGIQIRFFLFNISGEWHPSVKIMNRYVYLSDNVSKIPELSELKNGIIEIKKFLNSNIILDVDINCPCFLIQRNLREFKIILNPILRTFNFQTKMDAFSIYQKIDHYLMNKALPENETIEISDIDKLIQHGFDRKISFRKRK